MKDRLPSSSPNPVLVLEKEGCWAALEHTSRTLAWHSWSRVAMMTAAECTRIILTSILSACGNGQGGWGVQSQEASEWLGRLEG